MSFVLAGLGGQITAQAQAQMSAEDKEIVAKFKAADKNHDGKLTLAEAQAGMPRVASHFSYIDSQGRGYVTLDQILALANN
ncbi:EF-hand domain-containing protein [Polynucleobacter paneuropaeus]|nr:EF-hand domain-containing protein [Polynucleobacter paneuropaeus]MBT8630855.1 EF-hand domain-containing protein [Polynucleobacter paneuropaeus]